MMNLGPKALLQVAASVGFGVLFLLFMLPPRLTAEDRADAPAGGQEPAAVAAAPAPSAAGPGGEAERAALDAARNALGAETPAFLKGPYLQNGGPKRMTVMWESDVEARGMVEYGRTRETMTGFALAPLARKVQEVEIAGLRPETTYFYQVRVGRKLSDLQTFATYPEGAGKPYTMLVYGDSRSFPSTHAAIVRKMQAEDGLFFINTGDMVKVGSSYDAWRTEHFEPLGDMGARRVLWPVMGNHEANSPWYFTFFSVPGPGTENYYTFSVGDAKYVVVDSNLPLAAGSPQITWAEAEMKGSTAKWLIVIAHHPAYSTGDHGGYPLVQAALVPLLEKYRAALFFQGHDHNYERLEKNGVTYVTAGGGGARLRGATADAKDTPWSKKFAMAHHYCVVSIAPGAIEGVVKGTDGKEIDRFRIAR
ncbi:MAG: metallophosphoesterase family protein [Planctomycetes bacterium]|nr:metallophosphoesterase family protein [Planctomycetota bacterium]